MRRLLGRLALLLGSLAVGLGLAELAVRLVAPQPFITKELRWEEHDVLGFRLQPDVIVPGEEGGRINNLGLRDADIGPKPDGQRRLLVLGDSFTFGAGVSVDAAFPARLAAELAATPAGAATGGLRVINGGTVGYGTRRELLWLQTFGALVAPDEVLLAFFVGNDFTDNLNMISPRIVDGQRMAPGDDDEPLWQVRLRIAANESHLYRLLRKERIEPVAIDHEWRAANNAPAVERGLGRGRMALFARLEALEPDEQERQREAWAVTRAALDDVHAWCREHGAALKVVVIPDILQVDGEPLRVVSGRLGIKPADVHVARPQELVMGWCAEVGVPALDLLEPFRNRTREAGRSLHLGWDPHWNAEGHAFAARLLRERLWPDG